MKNIFYRTCYRIVFQKKAEAFAWLCTYLCLPPCTDQICACRLNNLCFHKKQSFSLYITRVPMSLRSVLVFYLDTQWPLFSPKFFSIFHFTKFFTLNRTLVWCLILPLLHTNFSHLIFLGYAFNWYIGT